MGLDQYAYATLSGPGRKSERVHLATWRKYYPLDEYMNNLYLEFGGKGTFNQKKLYLHHAELNDLQECVVDGYPDNNGDFFFVDDEEELVAEMLDYDLHFIEKARFYLNNEYKIYYTNWW